MQYIDLRPRATAPDPSFYRPSTAPSPQFQMDGSGGGQREIRERDWERNRSISRSISRSRSGLRSRAGEQERLRERIIDYDSDDEVDARIPRRYMAVEDDNTSTVYSFSPSRTPRGASTLVSRFAEDDSSEKTEEEARPRGEELLPKASHVFESQYIGESCLGGLHAARLTVVISTKVPNQPLFRWM
jgi:hypothetical protein